MLRLLLQRKKSWARHTRGPACRGFWVERGGLCLVAPPPSAGMPQSHRQTKPESNPVPRAKPHCPHCRLPELPGCNLPLSTPPPAGGLGGPQHRGPAWPQSRCTQLHRVQGMGRWVGHSCQVSKGHEDGAACPSRQTEPRGEAPKDTRRGRRVLTSLLGWKTVLLRPGLMLGL